MEKYIEQAKKLIIKSTNDVESDWKQFQDESGKWIHQTLDDLSKSQDEHLVRLKDELKSLEKSAATLIGGFTKDSQLAAEQMEVRLMEVRAEILKIQKNGMDAAKEINKKILMDFDILHLKFALLKLEMQDEAKRKTDEWMKSKQLMTADLEHFKKDVRDRSNEVHSLFENVTAKLKNTWANLDSSSLN